MTEQRTYHHGNLARALLDAVEEIVGEVGVEALTLREAARRAGVSHSAPAHHFGDLEGMLDAFALEGFQMLGQRMSEAVAEAETRGTTTPLDYLTAVGTAYLDFAMSHPEHYTVMFRRKADQMTSAEWSTTELGRTANATFGPLAVVVGQLVESGRIPADQGPYLASMLWSMVHGMASLWNNDILTHFHEDHTADELIAGVMGLTATLLDRADSD